MRLITETRKKGSKIRGQRPGMYCRDYYPNSRPRPRSPEPWLFFSCPSLLRGEKEAQIWRRFLTAEVAEGNKWCRGNSWIFPANLRVLRELRGQKIKWNILTGQECPAYRSAERNLNACLGLAPNALKLKMFYSTSCSSWLRGEETEQKHKKDFNRRGTEKCFLTLLE